MKARICCLMLFIFSCYASVLFADMNENEKQEQHSIIPELKGILLLGNPLLVQAEGCPIFTGVRCKELALPGHSNTLLTSLDSLALRSPLTQERINEIKQALISFYTECGHPIVEVIVPPQEISCGVLQLVVSESKIGNIRVKGNRWISNNELLNKCRLSEGQEIDISVLREDALWINRATQRRIQTVFYPGEAIGTTDIELWVQDDKPWRVYAGANNAGDEVTGTQQRFIGFSADNLWKRGHRFSYQYTTSGNFKKLHAHAAQYTAPLSCRHEVNIFGGYSQTHVLRCARTFKHTGYFGQFSGRYRIPKLSLCGEDDFFFGFDYKRTNYNLEFADAPVFCGDATISQVMAGYHKEIIRPGNITFIEIEGFLSPKQWLSHQSKKDYERLRAHARSTYFYTRAALENNSRLPCGFTLLTRLEGQLSTQSLLSSEQFGLGGFDTVRGYAEREVNGDDALFASVELHALPFSFLKQTSCRTWTDSLTIIGFVDYGIAHNLHRVHGEKASIYLLGVGPGLRYLIDPNIYLRLDWGFQLHKTGYNPQFTNRVHFSLVGNF